MEICSIFDFSGSALITSENVITYYFLSYFVHFLFCLILLISGNSAVAMKLMYKIGNFSVLSY